MLWGIGTESCSPGQRESSWAELSTGVGECQSATGCQILFHHITLLTDLHARLW